MIISPHAQGSVEWQLARSGIPTASEFDNIVTSKMVLRDSQMLETYLARKLAEKWLGGPVASLNVFDADQGKILEEEAIPWYELEFSEAIQRVGLITTDDGRIGCSPDGLLGDNCGVEFKCPKIETHIGYLLAGEVPKDYLPQVYGALLVTGRPSWKFVSYRRRLPALVKVVERDESILARLQDALDKFLKRFDEGYARLCDMNGGPPKHLTPPIPKPEQHEPNDDVPTP